MNEKEYAEIMAALAANEMEHKSFKRRLDEMAETMKKTGEILVVLERQSNAIERMGRGIDRVEKKVDNVDNRVAVLEKEPGEKWKKITSEIIKWAVIGILSGVAGYVLRGIVAAS